MDTRVTAAARIAAPITQAVVELKGLRTDEGGPVYVLCERVPDEVALEAMETLPGARPAESQLEPAAQPSLKQRGAVIARIAPLLIEAGCSLTGPNGEKITPAFYWDPARKVEGSLPAEWLGFEDKTNLVEAVLVCNGFGGGAGPSASFSPAERDGAHGGVGTPPARTERGPQRMGGAARPVSRVQPRGDARAR